MLDSINRASVASMTNRELGKILLLPVRLCIAQYADEVRSYIARYWVQKGTPVPALTTANTAQFARIKIQVKSVSSAEWKGRFTDFMSLFVTSNAQTFRSAWLFPRILQTVIAELGLSNRQVSECLLVLFLHQAHLYGRLWTNDCLGGFGMFGSDRDISGLRESSLVDAGLLTLAHPKNPNRAVSTFGRLTLLKRSWTSMTQGSSAAQAVIRDSSVSHPSWAKPFFDGLIWPFEFDFAHIPTCLEEPIQVGTRAPKVPEVQKKAYVNAFMIAVLCGLYCRLMHLKSVCVSQDYDAFTTLLFEGCKFGDDLWKSELFFFDKLSEITPSLAKEILAFYQSGILGLHSSTSVYDKLKGLLPQHTDFVKRVMEDGRFQIDQHWLLDRAFVQSYRAKLSTVKLPDWVGEYGQKFGSASTMKHLVQVVHIPTFWILPRTKDEALDICTAPIPIALQSRVKPPLELPEVSVDALRVPGHDSAWISSVENSVGNTAFCLETSAVGGEEEDDVVIASVADKFQLFEEVASTDVADQVSIVDSMCFGTISLFCRRWKMPSLLVAMRSQR